MNNYGGYITPQESKDAGDTRSLQELIALAKRKPRRCFNCDEMQWNYGGCGMCFSCTTGEADASDDLELTL